MRMIIFIFALLARKSFTLEIKPFVPNDSIVASQENNFAKLSMDGLSTLKDKSEISIQLYTNGKTMDFQKVISTEKYFHGVDISSKCTLNIVEYFDSTTKEAF